MIVIIPDIHLDTVFVEKILRRHPFEAVRRLVLLGDYFDSHDPRLMRAGPLAMCRLLSRLVAEWGDKLVPILGNHDAPYLECFLGQRVISYPDFDNSHYSTLHAEVILDALNPSVWTAMRLLHTEGRVVFSHAGLNAEMWHAWLSRPAFRAKLRRQSADLPGALRRKAPEVSAAGIRRLGDAKLGGILWHDWAEWTQFPPEVQDGTRPWWQVFGHTKDAAGARVHGAAVCLDGAQQVYATLDTEAGFLVRSAASGETVFPVAGIVLTKAKRRVKNGHDQSIRTR